MYVGCTRKLLDYIGAKPEADGVAIDPILRWSANILTLNHRKAIAVCNDSSRYGFVLYGIKAKDIKNLGDLVLQGVRSCLEAECIDEKIIEAYLAECGLNVHFGKTVDSSKVAMLNRFCERVSYKSDLMRSERLVQQHILRYINEDFITLKTDSKRDYILVHKKFAEDLSSRYGKPPFRCTAAELEVTLELNTECRRRVIVPMSHTFRQFHHVLQVLFGWQRCHLHDFQIEHWPDGRLKYTLVDQPREFEFEDETSQVDELVQLSEIFPRYGEIQYTYDFGDNWIHRVEFVRIIDDHDKNHAVCIEGVGDGPMEDAGGPDGHARMLEILPHPDDPRYENLRSYLKGIRWNPFDLDQVNQNLCRRMRVNR